MKRRKQKIEKIYKKKEAKIRKRKKRSQKISTNTFFPELRMATTQLSPFVSLSRNIQRFVSESHCMLSKI